jgi:hypothetical protein
MATRRLARRSRTYAAAAPLEVAINGDDRSSDGQPDIDVQQERERRDDDHTAAESEERAEEAGTKGDHGDGEDEEEWRHVFVILSGAKDLKIRKSSHLKILRHLRGSDDGLARE